MLAFNMPKKVNFFCLFLVSLFFLVTNLNALEVKGQSTYTYKSLKKDRPLAELEAKKNALKNYFNNIGDISLFKEFKKNQDTIYENLDEYVTINSYLIDEIDKKKKQIKLVIQAEIQELELQFLLNANSAVEQSTQISDIALYIVARKTSKVLSFKEKETRIDKFSSSSNSTEISSADNTGAEVTTSFESESMDQTGGSEEKKSDIMTFGKVDGLDDKLFTSVLDIFTENGFEPFDADRFINQDAANEYMLGDSLSSNTKNNMYTAIENKGIKFLMISKITAYSPSTDPDTGEPSVYVETESLVFDCSRMCRGVAAAGPTPVSQIGSTESQAQTNAMIESINKNVIEIVYSLNSKNIN